MKNKAAILIGLIIIAVALVVYFAFLKPLPSKEQTLGTVGGEGGHVFIASLLDRNLTPGGTTSTEFDSLHKLFVEKVLSKNDLLLRHRVQRHWWGAGKDQLALVLELNNMDDVFMANLVNDSLFQAAWPTKEEQGQFNTAYNKYFVGKRPGEFESDTTEAEMASRKEME